MNARKPFKLNSFDAVVIGIDTHPVRTWYLLSPNWLEQCVLYVGGWSIMENWIRQKGKQKNKISSTWLNWFKLLVAGPQGNISPVVFHWNTETCCFCHWLRALPSVAVLCLCVSISFGLCFSFHLIYFCLFGFSTSKWLRSTICKHNEHYLLIQIIKTQSFQIGSYKSIYSKYIFCIPYIRNVK